MDLTRSFERFAVAAAQTAWPLIKKYNATFEGRSIQPKWAPAPLLKSREKTFPQLGWPRQTDSLCPKCVKEAREAILSGKEDLKLLTEGKPGYVPHRWASLQSAVQWITAAQGVAVIAHPARYKFTANEEYALFSEFKAHGGRGVEVITGSHTAAEAVKYAGTAREFGLAASRGSDFHSPLESRVDLGQLPDLPGRLKPVWEALAHRIEGLRLAA